MVRGGWFPPADYADALRARRVLERLRAAIARASDCFIDFRALEVVGVDLACAGNPADPFAPGAGSGRILAGVRRPRADLLAAG
jgi:hypothetical protein